MCDSPWDNEQLTWSVIWFKCSIETDKMIDVINSQLSCQFLNALRNIYWTFQLDGLKKQLAMR